MIRILLFASNPAATPGLALDEEIRSIELKIRAAGYRDALELLPAMATRPDDLLQKLNQYKPQIVHFSGHGSRAGEIILVDDNRHAKPVSAPALKLLFNTLRDNIQVVVLNACYSRIQAEGIREVIDCVIGMDTAIGDQAALVFSASFYRAIGFGRSIQEAFDQGKTALLLEGIPEESTPQLLVRQGIDPALIFLVSQSSNHQEVAMLETIAVPLLFKAVDFLFGEGSRILEERRERRKAELQGVGVSPETIASPSATPTSSAEVIQSREAALSQPVAEIAWSDSEAHIKHLLSLLDIYSRNYRLAKEQYAMWGSALVPPIIVSNLTEAENEIAKTTKELQAALGTVYKKKVSASEVDQA